MPRFRSRSKRIEDHQRNIEFILSSTMNGKGPPFFQKISDSLEEIISQKALDTQEAKALLLKAIITTVIDNERLGVKTAAKITYRNKEKPPICWICSYAIDLSTPNDTYGCFSIDHVIPKSEGGANLGNSNLKPAHRICNNIWHAKKLKNRTKKAYDKFILEFKDFHEKTYGEMAESG